MKVGNVKPERVAIVTGASRGIGRATAIRLARDFTGIAIVARDRSQLELVADAIREGGAAVLPFAFDLRDSKSATVVVDETKARFKRIDALVNIAGAVPQTDLFDMKDEEWVDGLSLKFHAARRLTIQAWSELKQTQGSVIITSGTSAVVPKASLGAVSSINAAIAALAKAFADRGVSDGVQVNCVLPGPVLTDRRMSMLQRYADNHSLTLDAAVKTFADESRISRYGQPEDIANTIAFLISPEGRWINGTALRVDGGEVKSV